MDNSRLIDHYESHKGLASDKWSSYLGVYERILSKHKQSPLKLLEIGVQNGGSLEIWSNYFPRAELILGCDINPACAKIDYSNDNTRIIVGDINSPSTLHSIFEQARQYDVIIDDGSHRSRDIISTFCRLFSHVSYGGAYIIEDLHCSYWQQFDGGLFHPTSSLAFFKALTDSINFEHWGLPLNRLDILQAFDLPPEFDELMLAEIHSIEFVNSMCILQKRKPEENLLGNRKIAGTIEVVSPVKQVANTAITVPKQKSSRQSDYGALPAEAAPISFSEIPFIIKNQQRRIADLEAEIERMAKELKRG